MGWASGSDIFATVITSAKRYIKDKKARKKFYKNVLEAFEGHDWDTQQECEGMDPVFDEVLQETHPDWFEDNDEEETDE